MSAARNNPRRVWGSFLVRLFVLSLSLTFIFWFLLTLVYCIPKSAIEQHLKESQAIMDNEGVYPAAYDSGDAIDNYTVAVMLNLAASGRGNPILSSLDAEYYSGSDTSPTDDLGHAINGEVNNSYPRYWHGYLVLIKPLLIICNIQQIRLILQTSFFVLAGCLSAGLARRFGLHGGVFAVAVLASLGLFSVATATATLPIYFSFAISICGSIWVAVCRTLDWKKVAIGFFVLGAVTVFFDFLDNPIVSWGLPATALLYTSYQIRDKPRHIVRIFAISGLNWLLGYGILWGAKWILATLVLHRDVIRNGLEAAATRTGTASGGTIQPSDLTPAAAISRNLQFAGWRVNIIWIVLIAFIVMFVLSVIRNGQDTRLYVIAALFLIVASVPFIWYAVLDNHSYIHAGIIAFRNLALTLEALSAGAVTICPFQRRQPVAEDGPSTATHLKG